VILDAALSLFAVGGYERTSLDSVAAAAGVTKPVLYDHFSSKQALFVALLEREVASMSRELIASIDPSAPLEARLRSLALAAIRHARRQPAASRLLFTDPSGDSEIRAAHTRAQAAARKAFAAGILADPVFEASPGLSRKASAELLGDLQNAVLQRLVRWAIDNPRTPAKTLAEVFVDVLWNGLSS
jgi:AcrR family transcriptional regulator